MTVRADREAGFTLIEMMIALALFGFISVAGYAMIESILSAQQRTQGRLDRLGAIQRALFVVTRDFEQIVPGGIALDRGTVAIRRNAPGGQEAVRYQLADGVLYRQVGAARDDRGQRLLDRVAAVRLRYYFAGAGWRDDLPVTANPGRESWPEAAGIALALQNGPDDRLTGTVERIVRLPALP